MNAPGSQGPLPANYTPCEYVQSSSPLLALTCRHFACFQLKRQADEADAFKAALLEQVAALEHKTEEERTEYIAKKVSTTTPRDDQRREKVHRATGLGNFSTDNHPKRDEALMPSH